MYLTRNSGQIEYKLLELLRMKDFDWEDQGLWFYDLDQKSTPTKIQLYQWLYFSLRREFILSIFLCQLNYMGFNQTCTIVIHGNHMQVIKIKNDFGGFYLSLGEIFKMWIFRMMLKQQKLLWQSALFFKILLYIFC